MATACVSSMLGTCASYTACKCITSKCSVSNETGKGMYLFFLFIWSSIASLLQHFGTPLLIHYEWNGLSINRALCGQECMGDQAVYRISFALFSFYALWGILSLITKGKAHNSYWICKFVNLLLFVLATPFLPLDFLDVWTIACKYASVIFMLLQSCMLIDFGYTFNDKLISLGGNSWKAGILLMCCSLYTLMFCILFISYTNLTYSIVILLVNIGMTILSLIVPHGTLLTSAIVSTQVSYIPLISMHPSSGLSATIGAFLTAGSLAYTAHSTSKTNIFNIEQPVHEPDQLEKIILGDNYVEKENDTTKLVEKEKPNTIHFFDSILVFASMYMPMVLTGFGAVQGAPELGPAIISQILCALLYSWTLIAPMIFPNRDFS